MKKWLKRAGILALIGGAGSALVMFTGARQANKAVEAELRSV